MNKQKIELMREFSKKAKDELGLYDKEGEGEFHIIPHFICGKIKSIEITYKEPDKILIALAKYYGRENIWLPMLEENIGKIYLEDIGIDDIYTYSQYLDIVKKILKTKFKEI